jgi:hypothetical protein
VQKVEGLTPPNGVDPVLFLTAGIIHSHAQNAPVDGFGFSGTIQGNY